MPGQYDDIFSELLKLLLKEVAFRQRFDEPEHDFSAGGVLRQQAFLRQGSYLLDNPSLPFGLQVSHSVSSAQIAVIPSEGHRLYALRELSKYQDTQILGWDNSPIEQLSLLSSFEEIDILQLNKRRSGIYFGNKVKVIPRGYTIETFYSIECNFRPYPLPNPWRLDLCISKTDF